MQCEIWGSRRFVFWDIKKCHWVNSADVSKALRSFKVPLFTTRHESSTPGEADEETVVRRFSLINVCSLLLLPVSWLGPNIFHFSQHLVLNHLLPSSFSTQNKPLFVGEPVSANPSSFSLSAYAQHDVASYEKATADRPFRVFDPSKPSNTVIYCACHSKLPNPTQRSIRYFNRILPRRLTVKITVSLNYKGRIFSVFSVECDFKFLNFPRNISIPRFPQHTTSFLRTFVTY